MSKIAEAIGSIVQKKLNGELLKAAQNGPAIPAKVGEGLGGSASDPATELGDEVFDEVSRTNEVSKLYSKEDPDLWAELTQPVKVVARSKEGRTITLNLNPPKPSI